MKSFQGCSVLLLIPEGQLSVTGKNVCTKYWFTAYMTKSAQEKCA